MIKVTLQVELPDELAQAFYQHIRDFDTKHDPEHEGRVKVQMLAESDWPADKMLAIMQAVSPTPQFTYLKKFDS